MRVRVATAAATVVVVWGCSPAVRGINTLYLMVVTNNGFSVCGDATLRPTPPAAIASPSSSTFKVGTVLLRVISPACTHRSDVAATHVRVDPHQCCFFAQHCNRGNCPTCMCVLWLLMMRLLARLFRVLIMCMHKTKLAMSATRPAYTHTQHAVHHGVG